jgi:hypothetical protein
MSAGRFIGGIIVLIPGIFVLIMCFMGMNLAFTSGMGDAFIHWILNFLIGILALSGGIIGATSKSGGGAAFIAGIFSLVLGLLSIAVAALVIIGSQYSLFQLLGIGPWYGITLEAILISVGAIVMLASGKE